MGIQVEFNPDLALRNHSEMVEGNRKPEECIPLDITIGETYPFLKKGQRNYWLFGEIPLLETKGNEKLSRPKASVVIVEAIHFLQGNEIYTKGRYKVVQIFEDDGIHFESYARVGKR